ncbi:BREX protein BrxB domain-containing protein [Rubinisphaera sp.]|uniref:BREX protein BrxB domain-containing protein n=1 Tax=Rubinisphaera sp. TaxID=2024857 RepID=UPI000C1127E9|nr:BREX protein BrxB domain-containing protein [Rubinisphaera sp.]MBV11172.1 hypothetical protein [Rubinisphaera sp.]HCS52261.1 DUF1788 domain-containing protein [Planctomycetaceae bacterium]
MSKVKQLLDNYREHISVPWQTDRSAAQRVIFCVYPEYMELRLRARLDEFEIATKAAVHDWALFDMTDMFPSWMETRKRYVGRNFESPQTLLTALPKFKLYIAEQFELFCKEKCVSENDVVAVAGVGSLFGFLKVKDVVDLIAPMVPGRLVVFFPGSYESNNYRLLDAYDGWGYLAIPITSDQ